MDRSLLARATDSSEAPTPGYLYMDLAKQAGSNPSVCADMARYLTNRLQTKQSPYVKQKCCKVLAKLCEQVPRNAFRRVVAQDANAVAVIKQALQFRGPLDPLRGDALNEAVRAAAREALDAVYSEAPAAEVTPGGGGMGGISSSYGASPHAGGGGGMNGGRRMEGIGNPMFADPRLEQQQSHHGPQVPANLQAAVKEAGEVVMGMIRDPLARNIGSHAQHQYPSHVPSQGHSGDLPGYNRSYGRPPPGASELSRQTNGQWTMASNRGPGAYNTNSYYQQRAATSSSSTNTPSAAPGGTSVTSGGVGGSWGNVQAGPAPSIASQAREPAYGTPSITITPGRQTPHTSGATTDGSYEKNLIMELCPPGGLKPVPPAEKLADFRRAVPSLNADWICPVLLDCLEDGQPWIIRAKALHVMEAAVAHGGDAYRNFFYACAEEIVPLASHPRVAIADPAKRVLQLLGVEHAGGSNAAAAPASRAAAPVAAPPASDLLDFGDAPAPTAAPPASAPPPPSSTPAPAAGPSSMFGGMQVKGKTPAPVPAAPPAPAPADLFDFGAPAAATEAPAAAGGGADPFAASASVASADSAPPSSMFAQMQVKDKPAAESSAASTASAPAPAPSGSAFGFINEEKKTSTPAPAAPAPPSFDPLLYSGTAAAPTAPKPMAGMPAAGMPHMKMQMSPEQLQAMAYQQMMMQQQMQQMQMAMMRGNAPPMPPIYRQTSGTGPQAPQFNMMPKQAKKDDKKFDFVKDAMISEKKH